MHTRICIAGLLICLAGTTIAQSAGGRPAGGHPAGGRLSEPGVRRKLSGQSHIEVDLGQRNTLIVGFNRYAQVLARQNVDSLLRLFVADYEQIADTIQSPTRATHVFFRVSKTDRTIDLSYTPQPTTSFLFRVGEEPSMIKTGQDTLQIVWESAATRALLRKEVTGVDFSVYDFSIYLFINQLSDVKAFVQAGGINDKLQTALAAVRSYKGHDLTEPKMSFDMTQGADQRTRFINPGLARSPFISLQPGVGVGLIRNQWVPSLNAELQFIPSRFHNVGYSVSYASTFFFAQSGLDNRFQTFRNDFLNVGLAFYYFNKDGRTSAFSRQIFSFYVGVPVHRRGPYFERDAIRLSGTVYQKGLFKVQPEFYMNGFFRNVNPGLRLMVGL